MLSWAYLSDQCGPNLQQTWLRTWDVWAPVLHLQHQKTNEFVKTFPKIKPKNVSWKWRGFKKTALWQTHLEGSPFTAIVMWILDVLKWSLLEMWGWGVRKSVSCQERLCKLKIKSTSKMFLTASKIFSLINCRTFNIYFTKTKANVLLVTEIPLFILETRKIKRTQLSPSMTCKKNQTKQKSKLISIHPYFHPHF